jgi:hypothetical protein
MTDRCPGDTGLHPTTQEALPVHSTALLFPRKKRRRCSVSTILLLFPVSINANIIRRTKIRSEGRQPFLTGR